MSNGNGSYLYVKNWSKFQHYKHRSPPWIKLYRNLFSDPAYRKLKDREKLQLISIWLLAATHDGAVPNDAAYVRVMTGLKHSPDLKTLINQVWLSENASTMLAQRQSRVEKRREEESKPVDKSLENVKGSIAKHLPNFLYRKATDV